jgi:threonine dehydratase
VQAYRLDQFPPEVIRQAAERIAPIVTRTPLLRLDHDGPQEIWLKLENLQPIRSFKIRGAANLMLSTDRALLEQGVWAASAGNMAQGVGYCAREFGVPCAVVVPDSAPEAKRQAIRALGARIVEAPFHDWFEIFDTRTYPGMDGRFVHAFSDPDVMAGNATIAAELLEDLQDFDAVVAPYGGGGLACGIAAGLRHLAPGVVVHGAEVDTSAPLAAAFAAGRIVPIEHTPSFVDGIGGPGLSPEMWEFASQVLAGAVVSSIAEIRSAVRTLATQCAVIAEGAGAAGVAAALAGRVTNREGAPARRVVCIVSGGNIDADIVADILTSEA